MEVRDLQSFFNTIFEKYKIEDCRFFGLGNIYRADDGFGIELIERIKSDYPEISISEQDDFQEEINRLFTEESSGLCLFFDTSDFDAEPGTVKIFEENDLQDIGKSFHKVPLKLYLNLLRKSGKESYLIAVQPETLTDTFFDPHLSGPVEESIEKIVNMIRKGIGS